MTFCGGTFKGLKHERGLKCYMSPENES